MIAVDSNLLVYAHREDSPWHEKARTCVEQLAEASAPWAIPWHCLHEFFAIVTHPKIYAPPTPRELAVGQIDAWFEAPNLLLVTESEGYWPVAKTLLSEAQISGSKTHDARVAALCLLHGVEALWTADRDFSRFPGLKALNPLIG